MKTIEITDEMYNSLMEISKELNTQDNRCTAMPYFFQIQTDETVFVGEGIGEEIWVCDGNILENENEEKQVVIEYKEWDNYSQAKANKLFNELASYEVDEILENAGYRQVNRDIEQKYQNAFFTEKACKLHIKQNHYRYNNPVDYLNYATRNPEMELVMKFLCEISGGELHK